VETTNEKIKIQSISSQFLSPRKIENVINCRFKRMDQTKWH